MKYVVFEAGSRAGFSAEMFFRAWKKQHPERNVKMVLCDTDPDYATLPCAEGFVRKIDKGVYSFLEHKNTRVFPADELTRQKNAFVRKATALDPLSSVDSWFYEKSTVNGLLEGLTESKCFIKVPNTFLLNRVCIKPNTLSAGSRNISFSENVCVSELVDITNEYVVDVLEKDNNFSIFAREVKLRSGYDKMVKFLPDTHKLVAAIRQFIETVNLEVDCTLFRGIFHLQIAEDCNGQYFFIEASKRISGSSIVNIFRGFNPFDILGDTAPVIYDAPFVCDKWYRYEDLVSVLAKIV